MMATTAPHAARYVIYPNGDDTYSVRDLETHEWLEGPDGAEDMTYRDAHDLRQEYIWS